MRVFFYGLFMDVGLLSRRGIEPSEFEIGFVDGYGLRIGKRATLVRCPESRAYGALMDIAASEAAALYAEESVADYVPEAVIVELTDGTRVEASCYNLSGDDVTKVDSEYADSLLELATRLGLPGSYLDQIRRATT
jgi:hypothetical protein